MMLFVLEQSLGYGALSALTRSRIDDTILLGPHLAYVVVDADLLWLAKLHFSLRIFAEVHGAHHVMLSLDWAVGMFISYILLILSLL